MRQALFLPEASDYIALSPAQSLSLVRPVSTSPFVQGLCQSAREHNLSINVGIHEPTEPPSDRLRNTLVWISAQGEIVHRYQKLHVFDIDLSATGGPKLQESESTEPGSAINSAYDFPLGSFTNKSSTETSCKIGSLICFDLRFPEPSLSLRRQGAQVLLYPSAFTVPTGEKHWEILLRARAIETQCWVIAAAQYGRHNAKRVSYGDSMVVDPNGLVVKRSTDRVTEKDLEREEEELERTHQNLIGYGPPPSSPSVFFVDIDLDLVHQVRRGIPLSRRTDIYPEI